MGPQSDVNCHICKTKVDRCEVKNTSWNCHSSCLPSSPPSKQEGRLRCRGSRSRSVATGRRSRSVLVRITAPLHCTRETPTLTSLRRCTETPRPHQMYLVYDNQNQPDKSLTQQKDDMINGHSRHHRPPLLCSPPPATLLCPLNHTTPMLPHRFQGGGQ